MKNNKNLNTSITAFFKDGTSKFYNTIEEASEDTKVSIAAIKIRANKKGCGGKNNIKFEWNDEHTRRHYQAKKSKNKGAGFEADVVNALKEIGYEGCCRAAGESKKVDNNKIDIIDTNGELPVNIQCKHTSNLPNYFNIKDACTDKSKPFCLLWKKSPEPGGISRGSVAVIPLDYFYELIKK